MTTSAIRQDHIPANPSRGPAAAAIRGTLRAAAAWQQRRATRRHLESLTPEQLRDVGIDPDTIGRGDDLPGDPWTTSRLMSLR